MSESEEENFCYLGKPLDPYDEDAFPKKRPITVEEQIATDAQGRRRFHGAFTGGFSAGFFNTVGSLEGWTPSEFKSTRQEKAQNIVQKPEDFMDQEDIGEYGIAPQTVRATKEYSTSKKRRKQVFSDGPIPGTPVLDTLLTSGNETVGYLLLKNLGIHDKIERQHEEIGVAKARVYGCQMPRRQYTEELEKRQYDIPAIYKDLLEHPKANTFGLGYQGLDRTHINLFQQSNLVVRDKNNKRFSIGGQAFGVGAFEEEDTDIYVKEDMSNYDFELKKEKDERKEVLEEKDRKDLLFGMFKKSQVALSAKKVFPPPTIPHSFTGKHKVRKSRFEPIVKDVKQEEPERHCINPLVRAKYLGEETPATHTASQAIKAPSPSPSSPKDEQTTSKRGGFDVSSLMSDRFVSAALKEDVNSILEPPVKKSETDHGTQDMRDAARMKMFGRLTRQTMDWCPCATLCKRFNVPEPFVDKAEEKSRKRTKNLIFENQKHQDEVDTFQPGISASQDTSENIMQIDETTTSQEPCEFPVKLEQVEESPTPKGDEDIKEDVGEEESAVKDITDRIGTEEKTDLYKAVFLSSSESSEDEESDDPNKEARVDVADEFKETLLSEQLLPKIKPLKEGILSNLSFHVFSPPKVEEKGSVTDSTMKTDQTYGPQMPSETVVAKEIRSVSSAVGNNSDDEWVEKGSQDDKKKKSKHKKEKKKHKHNKKSKKSHR